MADFIRVEVPTRNTSMGGGGTPITVSAYQVVNHDVSMARGDVTWTFGLENIPAIVVALNAALEVHQALNPKCYDCDQAGLTT